VPFVPEDPSVPLDPEVPFVPDVPFAPEVPFVPEVPLAPEVPSVPLDPSVPEVPEVPTVEIAALTCAIVALYEDPAGFWDVSPVITICIKSLSDTPVAIVLSVSL
jgi:hypothetical protein